MNSKPYLLELTEKCTKYVIIYAESEEAASARAEDLHGSGAIDLTSGVDICELEVNHNGEATPDLIETYAHFGEVYDAPEQEAQNR